MPHFSVTYERWNEDALEAGESDDNGFIVQDVSLRDAVRLGLEAHSHRNAGHCEPSCSQAKYMRWLTFPGWNTGTHDYYETGIEESRSLHIPDSATVSSRKRIARLFGCKV